MSEPVRVFDHEPELLEFGKSFVKSEAFRELFREGMTLVEDTATYLDGPGRTESNVLTRQGALTYASESMRLTTRLMQIASWLLVQRAVSEGEITPAQAQREKDRVRLAPQDRSATDSEVDALPERIRELIALALRLHARIMHLDRLITMGDTPARQGANPLAAQVGLLRRAFERA